MTVRYCTADAFAPSTSSRTSERQRRDDEWQPLIAWPSALSADHGDGTTTLSTRFETVDVEVTA